MWPRYAERHSGQGRVGELRGVSGSITIAVAPTPGRPGGSSGPLRTPPRPSEQTKTREGESLEGIGSVLAGIGLGPETPAPNDLSPDEQQRLSAWVWKNYPQYKTQASRRQLVDACLAHHRAKGTTSRDWEAEISEGDPPPGHFPA